MSKRLKLYVGIDESNEGKDPTIYCAVFTTLSDYAKIHPEKIYIKKRSHTKKSVDSVLSKNHCQLYYFVISRELKEMFKPHVKPAVLSLLISATYTKFSDPDMFCYVDGDFKSCETILTYLEDVYNIKFNGELLFIPHGDRRVKIINIADEIAHMLKQLYIGFKNTRNRKYKHNLEEKIKLLEQKYMVKF